MIWPNETALNDTVHAGINEPFSLKKIRVFAKIHGPNFGSPTGAYSPTLNGIVIYSGYFFRLQGSTLQRSTDALTWTLDTATFEPAAVTLHGRISLAVSGGQLYAVVATSSGLYHNRKSTPTGAWAGWAAVGTIGSITATTSQTSFALIPTSTYSSSPASVVGFDAAKLFDGLSNTFYDNTSQPSNVMFSTSGTYTVGRIDIQAADWSNAASSVKTRTPKRIILQRNIGGTWTDQYTIRGQRGWRPNEIRSFTIPDISVTGAWNWRIRCIKSNGPGGFQMAAFAMYNKTTATVGSWRMVAAADANAARLYYVRYDSSKHAYMLGVLIRSGVNLTTWTFDSSGATGLGEVALQYMPDDMDVESDGNKWTGVLLTTDIPGDRIETFNNDTLRFTNSVAKALVLFPVYGLTPTAHPRTGLDSFSDAVIIDTCPDTTRRSVLHGRIGYDSNDGWHVTATETFNEGLDADVTRPNKSYILYRSKDIFDWSLPQRLWVEGYTAGVSPQWEMIHSNVPISSPGRTYAIWAGTTRIHEGYLDTVVSDIDLDPSFTELTGRLIDLQLGQDQVAGGSITLSNSDGLYDSHASLPTTRRWELQFWVEAEGTPFGFAGQHLQLIGMAYSNDFTYGEQVDARRLTVNFTDVTMFLNDNPVSEEWYTVDPLMMWGEGHRRTSLQVVSGEWTHDQVPSQGLAKRTMSAATAGGVAFHAASAMCMNGRLNVFPQTAAALASAQGWVIRGIDNKNLIRALYYTTGGVERIKFVYVMNGVEWFEEEYSLAFNSSTQITFITRWGKIYVVYQNASGTTGVINHTINNKARLNTGTLQSQDALYRGAFGYYSVTATSSYNPDQFMLDGRWMTIEKTVRHLSAKAGVFKVTPQSQLSHTGFSVAAGTQTVAGGYWPFSPVDSVIIKASSGGSFGISSHALVNYDRYIEFNIGVGTSRGMIRLFNDAVMTLDMVINYTNSRLEFHLTRAGVGSSVIHYWPLSSSPDQTPWSIGFTVRRYDNDFPAYHIQAAVFIAGRLITALSHTPIDTVASAGGEYAYEVAGAYPTLSNTWGVGSDHVATGLTIWEPKISTLTQLSDPITLDPGESAMQAINRVTEGLDLQIRSRWNNSILATRGKDATLRGTAVTIERTEAVGSLDQSYATDTVRNHIRVQGAYVEGEYADYDSIGLIGHRFMIVQNPYLYTREECIAEAQRLVKLTFSYAKQRQVQTLWAPFLSADDKVIVQDRFGTPANYIVTSHNLSYGLIGPASHTISLREDVP